MSKPGNKKAEESARPAYAMPQVELGDVVLWHPNAEEPPVCAGVVTEVSNETISLSLLHRNFYNMEPKDGVRHCDHPDRALIVSTESGCWSHKKGFLEAAAQIAAIEDICFQGVQPEA